MSACRAWFPFYGADYLADTQHLTTEQHGAYCLMLISYARVGYLPANEAQLAKISGLTTTRFARHVGPVVMKFFTVDGDRLRQKRMDVELAKTAEISEKRRAAGIKSREASEAKSSHHVSSDNNDVSSANVIGLSEHLSVQSQPQLQEQKEEAFASLTPVREAQPATKPARRKVDADLDPDFLAWWELYPNAIGRAEAAKAYAARRKEGMTSDDLAAKLTAWTPAFYKPDYPLHASTWLRKGRWTDGKKSQHHVAYRPAVGYKPRPSDWVMGAFVPKRDPKPHYDLDLTAEHVE